MPKKHKAICGCGKPVSKELEDEIEKEFETMPNIQKLTDELTDACLADAEEYHADYTSRDLFNATWIFSHFLTNEIFRANLGKLPPDKLEELVATAGEAIHELVLSTTDIDLKKI